MPKPTTYSYKHRGRTYPTSVFVFDLHDQILEEFGGNQGVRDRGLILSALDAPVRGGGGEDFYPTFFAKVAALGYLIANNHGFTDANKRTALNTVEITLSWNAEHPRWSQETKVLVFKLLGAGHLTQDGLRFALLSACGYDIDQYDDLKDI